MEFGEKIKKLRRDREMTQEQLADYLSISSQAVSRWETNSAMPDISLLPALCNLFHVTADSLLGIDVGKIKEAVEKIRENAKSYSARDYFMKAEEILRQGLKEYPDSYELMVSLMHVLFSQFWGEEQKAVRGKYRDEAIRLGEAILAGCMEEESRHAAVQILVYAYKDAGKKEKAMELAWKMPVMAVCREMLLTNVHDGTKKYEAKQQEFFQIVQNLMVLIDTMNCPLDTGEDAYTKAEEAQLREKEITLLSLLFEDGDYGFFHSNLYQACERLARYYGKTGETEKCLARLSLAAEHAIGFNSFDMEEKKRHTSLLVRDSEYGCFSISSTETLVGQLLSQMENAAFDAVRETKEFTEIREQLASHEKQWQVMRAEK